MEAIAAVGLAGTLDQLGDRAKSIVCSMYTYYEAVRDAPKRSEELRHEIGAICDLLNSLIAVVGSTANPSFDASFLESIAEFEKTLNEINGRVAIGQTKGIKRRLKWPFTK